jgi:hypothetical protein
MPFRIETDEEEYRLVGPNGETGVEIEYGCHATVDVDGALYYTNLGVLNPDAEVGDVYRVDPAGPPVLVESATAENVRFSADEDEEEDEREDEEEEEDEESPVLLPDEDEEIEIPLTDE